MKSYKYERCKAIYVVDYQTFDVVIDLGFRLTVKERLQMNVEIEVPQPKYGIVKRILSDLLWNKELTLETLKHPFYGVWLANVYIDGKSINLEYFKQVTEALES